MRRSDRDEVLRALADTLTRQLRAGDVIARLGGDEFAVLLLDVDETEGCGSLAHDLATAIRSETIPTPNGPAEITASIGVVPLRPGDSNAADGLIAAADRALYE